MDWGFPVDPPPFFLGEIMYGTVKFTFKEDGGEVVSHYFPVEGDTWPTLVEKFFYFLRGCSFPMVKGEFIQHFADLLEDWNKTEMEGEHENH